MNVNQLLTCDVCQNKVLVKIQAGYVEGDIPFSYNCPNCSITIDGSFNLTPPHVTLIQNRNAKTSNDIEQADFILQLSSEFYTYKISKPDMEKLYFSPFIQHTSTTENIEKYAQLADNLIKDIDSQIPIMRRIVELHWNDKHKFLLKQLVNHGIIKNTKYGYFLKLSLYDKISNVINLPYSSFIKSHRIDKKHILELLEINLKKRKKAVDELKDYFRPEWDNYLKSIFKLLVDFSVIYKEILPVIINEAFTDHRIENIKHEKGIAQTDFEKLKNYYVDFYETFADLAPLLIGLQNIHYRGTMDSFSEGWYNDFGENKAFKNGMDIENFVRKVKSSGNRIKVFSYEESVYSNAFSISSTFNNDIRNSIAHYDYTYDSNQQLIHYINKSTVTDEYLIEFSKRLIESMKFAIYSWWLILYLYE